MKVKISVTLSRELLQASDQFSNRYRNRSEFIEAAAWTLIGQMLQEAQNAKDIEIFEQRAAALNREAADVLAYQVVP